MAAPPEDLGRRLRQARGRELENLVLDHAGQMEASSALQVLRNPWVTRAVIESLLAVPKLMTYQSVRAAIAAHPRTPEPRAVDLVSGLFWRELVRIGCDSRVRPTVRRAADLALADRWPGLSVGERIAVARTAGPGAIPKIRQDGDPKVIGALLQNSRLTEGALLVLTASERTRPEVLEAVARNRRWGVRPAIRVALCRNPRTPAATSVELLSAIRKRELAAVASDDRIAAPVRQRAELLLGRES